LDERAAAHLSFEEIYLAPSAATLSREDVQFQLQIAQLGGISRRGNVRAFKLGNRRPHRLPVAN